MSHPEWMAGSERVQLNRPIQPTTPQQAVSDDHRNSTAAQSISSSQRSWFEVYEFVQLLLARAGVDADELHPSGTAAWRALSDDDPAKFLSCLLDSPHHVLRVEAGQEARVAASKDVAAADDWTRVARTHLALSSFYTQRPWLRRVTS